jgi:hypothetical protein
MTSLPPYKIWDSWSVCRFSTTYLYWTFGRLSPVSYWRFMVLLCEVHWTIRIWFYCLWVCECYEEVGTIYHANRHVFPNCGQKFTEVSEKPVTTTWQAEASSSSETSANFHPPALEGVHICGHVCENPVSAVLCYSKVHRYCGNITRGHMVKSNLMQTAEAAHASCYCVAYCSYSEGQMV